MGTNMQDIPKMLTKNSKFSNYGSEEKKGPNLDHGTKKKERKIGESWATSPGISV